MIEVSWSKFEQKFQGREQFVFEEVCYHIFYTITKNSQGIFRYKNHPGIETIDILYQGKYIGFQAKYFQDDLTKHKSDFLDTITKTRAHNSRVQKIIYFLPIDPGCNEKGVDVSLKPQWMQDVENEATKQNLEIEWFGLSKFQSFFAKEGHQYLARHYFDTNPDLWDCIDSLIERTQTRLQMIHSEINYHDQIIHIDHSDIVKHLSSLTDKQIAIISGQGGIGKTAVIKDWFSTLTQDTLNILLQPDEVILYFSEHNLLKDWHSRRSDFLLRTKEFSDCILVIDATEKIMEEKQLSELLLIIQSISQEKWKIVFTTRTIYLNQLHHHLKICLPKITIEDISLPLISNQLLKNLSQKYHFTLPINQHVFEVIQIPFNLYAYLSCIKSSENISLDKFEEIVWNHFILGDMLTDTSGDTFIKLVKNKLITNSKYLEEENYVEDIKKLIQRGIIAHYDGTSKYIITHDIYEEWAIIRLYNGQAATLSQHDFEQYIQSTYLLRRAFRIWLNSRINKLDESKDDTITALLSSENELIIAEFLLTLISSCNLEKFLDCFALFLFENNGLFFDRIVSSIYHIGRSDKTNPLLLGRQEPLKDSWETIIHFSFRYFYKIINITSEPFILLMLDWSLVYPNSGTTRICSKIGWTIIDKYIHSNDKIFKLYLKVIAASCLSDKDYFFKRLNEHLNIHDETNNWKLNEFCKEILTSSEPAYVIAITNFPKLVIKMAWKYWRQQDNFYSEVGYDLYQAEHDCGLSTRFMYSPVNYFQTPIYKLLLVDPLNTVDFIIDFTNECIHNYISKNHNKLQEIQLSLTEGKTSNQYITIGLWNMYRGNQIGDHWPSLLQAMHMTLEHYCIKIMYESKNAQNAQKKSIVESILTNILSKSISASLTAIVVSLIEAFPYDFSDFALLLLPNAQIRSFDFYRSSHESGFDFEKQFIILPQTKHNISQEGPDNHPCRVKNLENTALQYQLFPPKDNPNLKSRTELIINNLAKDYDNLSTTEKFSISRMDLRCQKQQIIKDDKNQTIIVCTPQFASGDKEDFQKQYNESKSYLTIATKLITWSLHCLFHKTIKEQSYSDTNDVLNDFDIIASLYSKSTDEHINTFFYIPAQLNTISALIICYSNKLTKKRINQFYHIIKYFLNRAIDNSFQPSNFKSLNLVLYSIPFFLQEINIFKYLTLSKLFILYLFFDENFMFIANERLCDYCFAGIRNYMKKTNDVHLYKKIKNQYVLNFYRYNIFLEQFNHTSKPSQILLKSQKYISKILIFFHIKIPHWLYPNEYYTPDTTTFQHPISRYKDSFYAQHRYIGSKPYNNDIEAQLHCNLIQFINPTIISIQDENSIIQNFNLCIQYLYLINEQLSSNDMYVKLSHIDFLRDKYLEQLSLCALSMTDNNRQKLIQLANEKDIYFLTDFINKLFFAKYNSPHSIIFWQILKSLLPYATKKLENLNCKHNEYRGLLDAFSLISQQYKQNTYTFNCQEDDSIDYFNILINTLGSHRYLAVCICKFINSIGQDYLLESLSWISDILRQANNKYDDNQIAISFKNEFEKLIPHIEERLETILPDQQMRSDLTTILDYLIIQNSREAFKLREAIL